MSRASKRRGMSNGVPIGFLELVLILEERSKRGDLLESKMSNFTLKDPDSTTSRYLKMQLFEKQPLAISYLLALELKRA